jgi:hypothetical protein
MGLTLAARAQAPDLEARLDSARITFRFLETPAGSALQRLGELVGVPVTLAPEADTSTVVTFRGTDMPARRAFRWVTRLAGLLYLVRDRDLLIDDPVRVMQQRIQLHVFDVRDLTMMPPDFPAPDISPVEETEEDAGGVIFGSDEPSAPLDVDALVELIVTDNLPETWEEEGFSIQASGGLLLVTHIPEVQAAIGKLLGELRAMSTRPLELEVWALRVAPAIWTELLCDPESGDARTILDPAAFTALMTRAGDGVEVLDRAETSCQSAQHVHAMRLGMREVLADVDVEVACGSATADPVMCLPADGLVLDVRPVVAADRTAVTLSMRLTCGRFAETRTLAYGPGDDPPGKRSEPVRLELPVIDMVKQRVTVRVPAFGACALTSTTQMLGEEGRDRLVLVVQPRPVQEEE